MPKSIFSMRGLLGSILVIVLAGFLPGSLSVQSASPAANSDQQPTLESVLTKYRARGIEKWEDNIQKLEKRDAEEVMPDDSLLFFGSSSIRRWDTMGVDMVPFPSINRGYGGANYVDMVLFADRILSTRNYRALLMFAANDVKREKDDSTPEEVDVAVREIIRVSKSHHPDVPIFIIEVTPTESRLKAWANTRQINATLREIALSTPNTWFITTAQRYLNPGGTVKSELFVEDKLHLNADGYRVWASIIKAELETFLPEVERLSRAKK